MEHKIFDPEVDVAEKKPQDIRSRLRQCAWDIAENLVYKNQIRRSFTSALPQVALTFDDGPNPETTPRILDDLAVAEVKASFFIIGREARKYPDIVRRIDAEGHGIGCHTDTHPLLSDIRDSDVEQECKRSKDTIEQIVGRQIHLFRPPYGILRVSSIPIPLKHKMRLLLWSVDSYDYRFSDPEKIVRRLQRLSLQKGDVLLFHDTLVPTMMALPSVIANIKSQGLTSRSAEDPSFTGLPSK